MVSKTYLLQFGAGAPSAFSGLSPTFTVFSIGPTLPWANIIPPGISEIFTGAGLYMFTYGTTLPVAFVVDGGPSLSGSTRYITGILDPIQAVDQYLGLPGVPGSYGSTSVDPSTVFGYLSRNQEVQEGLATFNKATGQWIIETRGGTAIQSRVLTNSSGSVTKS